MVIVPWVISAVGLRVTNGVDVGRTWTVAVLLSVPSEGAVCRASGIKPAIRLQPETIISPKITKNKIDFFIITMLLGS